MKRKKRKLFIVLAALAFVLISIPRLRSLISHYRQLGYYGAEIIKLRTENEMLREKIQNLKEDPYHAERILREEFGYIKEGEYIYRIHQK